MNDETIGTPPRGPGADDSTLPLSGLPGGGGRHPAQVGRYRVLRVIGIGGMGVVYEAEQDRPRRTVALKVLKPGVATPSLLRRFEQETHVLGRLQHPGIAQIYEAGTADTGLGPQPYFAMELIKGRSLRAYAVERKLGTRQRLELMARVCDAVHHAHQKGVIHRDLKPGNILVDESGQPKILDFGVARATDSDVQATMHTDVGQLIGTIPYMSPEQVSADPNELDTRSDVYALGVMLYELLAERLPYDVSRKMIPEAVRVIREDDPAPLSTVNRVFRGDVETIAGKALEKDRARRYGSAAELAADIRRYLQDEPIVARPATATYQLRKFARRNKALVAGVGGVMAALAVGAVASTWLAIQATRARAAAAEQRDRAEENFHAAMEAVDRYLTQVGENRELKAHGLEPLRRELLGTAKEFYERFAAQRTGDPKLRKDLANAQLRLGFIDRHVGALHDAEAAFTRAIELFQQIVAEEPDEPRHRLDLLNLYNDLALVYSESGQSGPAEATYKKALAMAAKLAGDEAGKPDFLTAVSNIYDNLGSLYNRVGRAKEAEEAHQKGLALRSRLTPESTADAAKLSALIKSRVNLGSVYATTGRPAEAVPLLELAVADGERLVAEHPDDAEYQNDLGASLNNLGGALTLTDRIAESRVAHEKSAAVREKLAARHPAVTEYRLHLAGSYCNLGELAVRENAAASALEWFEKAVAGLRRILEDEPRHAVARYYLSYTRSWEARALEALGRYNDAVEAWDEAIAFDARNDPELRAGKAAAEARVQQTSAPGG